jgi:hypothetical protein
MSEDLKQRRALANARLGAAMYQNFNESLVKQLAAANERAREFQEKLRGNNMIRRVAARMGVPQSVVLDVLYTCVEERLNREKEAQNG